MGGSCRRAEGGCADRGEKRGRGNAWQTPQRKERGEKQGSKQSRTTGDLSCVPLLGLFFSRLQACKHSSPHPCNPRKHRDDDNRPQPPCRLTSPPSSRMFLPSPLALRCLHATPCVSQASPSPPGAATHTHHKGSGQSLPLPTTRFTPSARGLVKLFDRTPPEPTA